MMTRKKIYTYLALLFCTPTALFSAQKNKQYTIVGINKSNGNDEKPSAIFASTDLNLDNLYHALSKTWYNGKMKSLCLYTKKKTDGGVIWKQEDYNTHSLGADSDDTTYEISLNDIANKAENGGFEDKYAFNAEDLEKACKAWDEEKEPTGIDLPQDIFDNVYENRDPKNNEILIIRSAEGDSQYEVLQRYGVNVTENGTVIMVILVEEIYDLEKSSATIRDLKQKIQEKKNIPLEDRKLINAGRDLQNEIKLVDYGIKPWDRVHLMRKKSNKPDNNDSQNLDDNNSDNQNLDDNNENNSDKPDNNNQNLNDDNQNNSNKLDNNDSQNLDDNNSDNQNLDDNNENKQTPNGDKKEDNDPNQEINGFSYNKIFFLFIFGAACIGVIATIVQEKGKKKKNPIGPRKAH